MTRGGRDRNETAPMSAQSFMAGFGGSSSASSIRGAMQPSILGFVAQPEMPYHLSILFRAR